MVIKAYRINGKGSIANGERGREAIVKVADFFTREQNVMSGQKVRSFAIKGIFLKECLGWLSHAQYISNLSWFPTIARRNKQNQMVFVDMICLRADENQDTVPLQSKVLLLPHPNLLK